MLNHGGGAETMKRLWARFWRADRGAVAIDHIPVFFALTLMVLFIIEIGIAHFLMIRAQKAVELGARAAATLPPAHDGVPLQNVASVDLPGIDRFVPCFNPDGPPHNCEPPVSASCPIAGEICWSCTGVTGPDACDNTAVVDRVVSEMQRVEGGVGPEDVTLTYIYRMLGTADGPFVPEIAVSMAPLNYDLALITLGPGKKDNPADGLIDFQADIKDHDPTQIGVRSDVSAVYDGIAASAIGSYRAPGN